MKPNEIAVRPKVNWLKLIGILAITAFGFLLLPEKWQFLLVASGVLAILLIPSGFIRSRDPLNASYNVLKVTLGLIFLWGAVAPKGLLYHNDKGYRYWADLNWPWFEQPTSEEKRLPYFQTIGQTPLYALFDPASGPDSLTIILPAETVVQVEIETAKTTDLGDEFVRVIYTAGNERLNGWVKFNFLERVGREKWQKYVSSLNPTEPQTKVSQAALVEPNQCQQTDVGKASSHPTPSSTNTPLTSQFIYNVSQEKLNLCYVKRGDVLTVTPQLLTNIDWDPAISDGQGTGLNGANRLVKYVTRPHEFPAANLPIAALLIRVPGQDWKVLNQQRVFYIQQAGEMEITLNDRRGYYHDNSGEIKITCDLKSSSTAT